MPNNVGGAKRLAKLVTKWGGLPKHARQCPDCGGKLEINDAHGFMKDQYRYDIGCKDQDCRSVCGPTVKAVLKAWIAECPENDTAKQP